MIGAVEVEGKQVRVEVDGRAVLLGEAGPAAASCPCPAAGVCRHVLAAVLHLRGDRRDHDETIRPESDGKPPVGAHGVRPPGGEEAGGDESGIAEPSAADAAPEPRGPDPTAPGRRAGPQTIAGTRLLLDRCRTLLGDLLHTGLSHASSALVERLTTLGLSATAVHLPRLERELDAAATEIRHLLERRASADEGRLFRRLAGVQALVEALDAGLDRPNIPTSETIEGLNPGVVARSAIGPGEEGLGQGSQAARLGFLGALAGRHRRRYDEAGHLDLAGLGAWRWRTASGFEGLTVAFWDEADQRVPTEGGQRNILTWSDSRPDGADGLYDPAACYERRGPWAQSETLSELCRRRFRLLGAKSDGEGRLSGSGRSRVVLGDPVKPQELLFGDRRFTLWRDLRRYAAANAPVGLVPPPQTADLIVAGGEAWGERGFDEVRQVYRAQLLDRDREELVLEIPWREENESWVRQLEARAAQAVPWGILGRLRFRHGTVVLEPLVLLGADDVVNLTLDPLPISAHLRRALDRAFARIRGATAPEADDDELGALPPALETALTAAEDTLLQVAEAGGQAVSRLAPALRDRAGDLENAGLCKLATVFAALPESTEPAADLLRCRYLIDVLRRAAVRARLANSL